MKPERLRLQRIIKQSFCILGFVHILHERALEKKKLNDPFILFPIEAPKSILYMSVIQKKFKK